MFVSIASMVLGAFAAIGQRNIKRLMAYSSIGHMGFALIGLAAGTPEGVQGVLVYMAIYLAMTLGTFAVILSMRRERQGMVEQISDLSGLARTNPALAFFLAMLLFSLAGIPPLAGFFAKYYVFLAAIKAGLYALAVIGVLASVVGAYYYLLIVKIMYFDEPAKGFEPMPGELKAVLGIAGLFNLLYFVYPAPLIDAAGDRREIAVLMQLDPAAEAAGVRLITHDTIGSTNAEALRLAREGERGPLWITAKQQTAGRGRRGRTWVSEPGNLYASLLLTDPAPPDAFRNCRSSRRWRCTTPSAGRSRASPTARAEMAERPADRPQQVRRHPGRGRGRRAVVIGIGVNCAHHPAGTDFPATDLATAGVRDLAGSLFAALSAAMAAPRAMGPRRGLCRDPRRLARRAPPGSASRSGSSRATASCPAGSRRIDDTRALGSALRRWDNAGRGGGRRVRLAAR